MSKFEVLICLLWQGINLLWQCISLYFKYIYILHKNWYNWSIYLSDWKLCSLDWRNFQKLQWKTRNWSYYWKQTIQTVLANEAIGTVLTQCGSTAQCGSCVDYMHILKHLYFSCLNFYWAETQDWFTVYCIWSAVITFCYIYDGYALLYLIFPLILDKITKHELGSNQYRYFSFFNFQFAILVFSINPLPPRVAKSGHFVILLCLMANDFTRQRKLSILFRISL